MFNLANCRENLTFNDFVLVPKIFSSLYSTSILNLYIFHELNTWSRNPTDNISLKNCLFGTVKLTRSGGKSKFDDNARGIAFDGKGSWSFGKEFARNVVILGIDNISSSHTDSWKKNKFLVLVEGPTQYINDNTGTAEKNQYLLK